jgi:hypothetical protein
MKTTIIRVTRIQKLTVTEYVDVDVLHEDDDAAFTITEKAQTLIKAMDDCGHDIDWIEVSEVPDPYSHNTKWDTAIAPEKFNG